MKPRHEPLDTQCPAIESARAVGLRYVSDDIPGIRRAKARAGFRYLDARGKVLTSQAALGRVRALAIPPAWTDVWVCPYDDGHLQATGRDAKGRKQHRYHALWREVRDETKYGRMISFGECLPQLRRRIAQDLSRPGLRREKVLATVLQLMDVTAIRIGNEEYAKQNGSYGLTTMQDQHAKVSAGRVQFSFRGKSGKHHRIEVHDPRLARIVKKCQDIPGQELFQWLDEEKQPHDVTSGDVNDYLREICGADFTAKDFRTWTGTVLAAQALQRAEKFESQGQAKRIIKQAITLVAEKLGNTVAVCRKCYIHPSVLDGYLKGHLSTGSVVRPGRVTSKHNGSTLSRDERSLLEFLSFWRKEEERSRRRTSKAAARMPEAWQPRARLSAPILRPVSRSKRK